MRESIKNEKKVLLPVREVFERLNDCSLKRGKNIKFLIN